MEDERGAVGQLGNLALGTLLSDLGVEDSAGRSRVHQVDSSGPHLERDQIYSERFVDDDFGGGEGGRADWEEEVDREMQEERKRIADRAYRLGMQSVAASKRSVRGAEEDYDDEDEGGQDAEGEDDPDAMGTPPPVVKAEPTDTREATPPPAEPSAPERPAVDVHALYPDFTPDQILNFTDIYYKDLRPRKRGRFSKLERPQGATITASLEISTRDHASSRPFTITEAKEHGYLRDVLHPLLESMRVRDTVDKLETEMPAMEIDDWESRIVYTSDDVPAHMPPVQPERPINIDLDRGTWADEIMWEKPAADAPRPRFQELLLDMNDPEMMIERDDAGSRENASLLIRADAPAVTSRAARTAAELDPLNLSNDRFYEVTKEHRQRVRQTLGQLVIQHAPPANRLQLPFYKTRINKGEARAFHRPAMVFPTNIPLRFSKVRSSKKKKDERGGSNKSGGKGKDPEHMLKSTRDLTLKDTSQFVMYEYSEEYPPILSKLGMGSLIVNYYRKKDAKDEHIPRSDLGEPFVLDETDESPFMKFGSVRPGQTQPTLYNNMVRAPLFRHKPASTDFLLIRSTTKNEISYYLREIKNLFVVGQTYPLVQVPGPHARLVTNAIKTRLQMIAYRLVATTPGNRIKIHRIMRYFPEQNELQMRQRLKEFMAYNRTAGDHDQGYWKLKPEITPPEDVELQKLLPPEHMALCEAMQSGQRHLLDSGYTQEVSQKDEDNDDSSMSIEQRLAPWITSKNFLHATQGKAMLSLHGEGDPTGRGEAFAMLRVSMKEVFFPAHATEAERRAIMYEEEKKSGHKYNVEKQKTIYRSEVERIWKAQSDSLSNPVPPEMDEEDAYSAAAPTPSAAHVRGHSRAQSVRHDATPAAQTPGDDESQADVDTRVLKIRRFIKNKWVSEVVRDPGVIHAYVRQRQRIEDETTASEALVPTDDAAINAARRKRLQDEIAAAKKNQERRLQRKKAKAAAEGLEIEGGYKALVNKTDTKRRCGRCGDIGHMATNTSCRMWEAPRPSTMASSASSRQTAPQPAGGVDGARRPSLMQTASGMYGAPPGTPLSGVPPVFFGARATPGGPGTPGSAGSPPAASPSTPTAGAPKLKLKLGKRSVG